MRTNTYFLLIALLLVTSCMEPSEQMNNETGESGDPGSNQRASRVDEEQQHRLLEIYRKFERTGFDFFSLQYHSFPLIPYMTPRMAWDLARYLQRLRDNEGLPHVDWARGVEDELIDLYLHNPRVNRNPVELRRIWRQLHPDLPDMNANKLQKEVLRLYNRRRIIRAREESRRNRRLQQNPEVQSVDGSAPSTPHSGSGSEMAWEDIHFPSFSRLRFRGYESETSEASSSSPPYPQTPRTPRYPHSRR